MNELNDKITYEVDDIEDSKFERDANGSFLIDHWSDSLVVPAEKMICHFAFGATVDHGK